MTAPEFKDLVVEDLSEKPEKAKDMGIEGVLEWISRVIAAKDAQGVVRMLEAAGSDEALLATAVNNIKELTSNVHGKEIAEIEVLMEDLGTNKDKISEKVKEILTGDPKDKGKVIKDASVEVNESYHDLVDWIESTSHDEGLRESGLDKARKLDEESIEKVKAKIESLASTDKIKNKSAAKKLLNDIYKEKVETRDIRKELTNDDAKKISGQAKKIVDNIENKYNKASVTQRGEGQADKRHLIKAVEVMGKVVTESKNKGESWEKYIESTLTEDDRNLLIAGLSVLERETAGHIEDNQELYILMKQVRDSWTGITLEKAHEQRQKHLVERYGKSHPRATDEDRMMPERVDTKFLREHPELLQQWGDVGDLSDMLMDPKVSMQDYLRHNNRMGLNINYEMLKRVPGEENELLDALEAAGLDGIIDLDTIDTKGVPTLKLEGFTQEDRKKAQNIILQALLKEVRMLVSESVEGSSMMYDPRATRYLTLLTISGVSTDLKQTVGAHMKLHYLEYMWRNGYVDEEVYGRLLKFFSEQGPEYRLHEALKIREKFVLVGKEGKEVDIGEFNLYDFEKYLTRNVSKEDKVHFGMPDNVDRTYATALATKITPDGMAGDRKTFLKTMLRQHWGEAKYKEMVGNFDSEADFLDKFMGREGKYNDYIHKSYIYWIGNGRLGEVVGNGNLKSNESFELAQGVPEYYYKRDPRLMVMFLWIYKPQLVPDVLAPIMRMGITSLASMYGEEIATHFISLKNTNQGAEGIKSTFFRGGDDRYAEAWRMMWEDSLYDYDEYHETHGEHVKETIYFEKSSKKTPKDGHDSLTSRRTNEDTVKRLKRWVAKYDTDYGDDFFNKIDWHWAIKKYEHDSDLVEMLSSDRTGKEKLNYFIDHFGDDYFVTDGLKAKRGDQWLKYMGKYQDEFFKAATEYATNPEVESMAKLVAIVNSIVGVGKVGPFRERMREILYYMSKSRINGDKYDVFKVDNEGRIIFDKNHWVGSNQGEFPLPKMETIRVLPSMNMNLKSALAYRGLEGKTYEPLLERVMLRDLRASNAFPDIEAYNKAVNKWRFGLLWESDRSTALNLLMLVTGKSISEFIAIGLFEMPPHKFWEWVFENSEKTLETTLHVLGAGGGHH